MTDINEVKKLIADAQKENPTLDKVMGLMELAYNDAIDECIKIAESYGQSDAAADMVKLKNK